MDQETKKPLWQGTLIGWRDYALGLLKGIAESKDSLTADDLREAIQFEPSLANRYVYGAIFRIASQRRWIENTGTIVKSSRVAAKAHANPIWKSLLKK